METLWQDIRYGLRVLRKAPGFTLIAVLTLALGIGANSAIFSIVNAVLLEPLPFHQPGRLVQLWETEAAPGHFPFAGPDYLDWQKQSQTLAGTSLYTWPNNVNVSGQGHPDQATVVSTQANFFSLLGVQPLLGRTFARGEDAEGRNHEAVLSYGFWQRHFGGRRDVVGQSVELNAEAYTVVGVMPGWFRFPADTDLWTPKDMSLKALGPRGSHSWRAIGQMKPGVSVEQAQAELGTIAGRLARQYPNSNKDIGAVVVSLKEQLVGQSRTPLLVLLCAVALVLLIACANVANLLLVRATGRHREMALRGVMGAGRWRLIRQLLTESMLLAMLGAAFGIGLAWWGVSLFSGAASMPLPQPNPIRVDALVLLFTVMVAALIGLLFGLAPALQTSQLDLSEELKASAQAVRSPSGRRRLLRDTLVVGEIALSLALLIGAGLLLRSFAGMRRADIGIQGDHVLTADVFLPQAKYADVSQQRSFYEQLIDRLSHAPGIVSAAVSTEIPLEGGNNGYITIPGVDNPAFQRILVEWNRITAGYFQTLGIPLLQGRIFTTQEEAAAFQLALQYEAMEKSGSESAPPNSRTVAVINRTMARTFWSGQDPLGKIFRMSGIPVTVIGVVGDVREGGIRQSVRPQAYLPFAFALGEPFPLSVSLKTAGPLQTAASTLRSVVGSLDTGLAVFRPRTMNEVIADAMEGTTYQTALLGGFALLALLLAAVGIYGVMSYGVSQRSHEIGIRMAIGASPATVMQLVLNEGMRLIGLGLAIGVAGAFALTRFLSGLLYGVGAADPLTFVAVAFVLAAVATLACALPARRAMRVDPMRALREE